MKNTNTEAITVQTTVDAPVQKVWSFWTEPEHVVQWNNASHDWCSPRAVNDLRAGGRFNYRMEAKDGSMGFDFEGTYDAVEKEKRIEYTMDDGRRVKVMFESAGSHTKISETFDAEKTHSLEMQRGGWQAILDNFKRHVEAN